MKERSSDFYVDLMRAEEALEKAEAKLEKAERNAILTKLAKAVEVRQLARKDLDKLLAILS